MSKDNLKNNPNSEEDVPMNEPTSPSENTENQPLTSPDDESSELSIDVDSIVFSSFV